jgi:malate dehydrogenase
MTHVVPVLVAGVVVPSDEAEAFKGVNFAVLIGGWPRKEGMERNDLISKNVTIYRSQASALQKHAAPNCKVTKNAKEMTKLSSVQEASKLSHRVMVLWSFNSTPLQVLVVANPANTNALVLKEFALAPAIPAKNITCLTRLDHNRALGQMSEKLGVHVGDVKNAIVWGNHSSTQFPDASHATVKTEQGEKPVRELVADQKW